MHPNSGILTTCFFYLVIVFLWHAQATFHQECFKCLECKRRLPLGNVAMINGQLYCKNWYASAAVGTHKKSHSTIDFPQPR